MPHTLDASAVRAWCRLALQALGRAREEIDAINVYPVADGDTGTNLYLTMESAAQSVEAVFDGHAASGHAPDLAQAFRALSHGALIGARGNSGTILAQLLRGMTEALTDDAAGAAGAGDRDPADPAESLRRALRRAAGSAYLAVAHPVEGTMLTVATEAATAAERDGGGLVSVARAAHQGARVALSATTGQLAALGRAGVVDAGGRGLVAVLGALADALSGEVPMGPLADHAAPVPYGCRDEDGSDPHVVPGGPSFEVVYLLEAADTALPALRARLDALGDSLVVVGGDGLWNVHVHVDDAGSAIEAGIEAGRPYRIRVTHFGDQARQRPDADTHVVLDPVSRHHEGADDGGRPPERVRRAVVAVIRGDGLAELCARAGATVVAVRPGDPPASGEIAAAIRRANAREVVLLPNDVELRHAAGAAADRARGDGVRVALIPTRSAVQGIAALAVHEPARRFDEDVVAMTSAAGATRYAELAVAEHRSWTMAGICQAGDVLGLIDGDVAVIGGNLVETGTIVLDRMLAAGGELVTLVLGATAPPDLADRIQAHVQSGHLAVDTVVYEGGHQTCPLLIGVE
ncbi:DAK2 domain-containing protein [Streptomyces sp. SPB162]|uniref:DAK2 domain-containing protein n=1 Tax=Streptomyces sp. SPB162 TaxID=2940560 RepID=UPI00240674EA|nr:DAK2 domain-containing protein [Streptomyces sp. SPB162]MDF9815903.1 DAK2 domain fusion protein YloV [Streptomyces sp. SPB162]